MKNKPKPFQIVYEAEPILTPEEKAARRRAILDARNEEARIERMRNW